MAAIKKVFSAERDKKLTIVIQKLPPAPRFKELLQKLDTTEMDRDKIEIFVQVWPPDDEKSQLLDEHKADPTARWDKPEMYVLSMNDVSMFEIRVGIWKYILGYPEERDFALNFGARIENGLRCMRENKVFKEILGVILGIGNLMNAGNQRGQADGFSVEILTRLSNIADNNKKSMLYLVVNQLKELEPDVSINKEFEPVVRAQGVNLKDFDSKVKTITDGFNSLKMKCGIIAKQPSDAKGSTFVDSCNKFITETEPEINKIKETAQRTANDYKTLCDLLRISPDDDKAKSTEEFFKFFSVFFEQLDKILAETNKGKRMAEVKKQSGPVNRVTVPQIPKPLPESEAKASQDGSPTKSLAAVIADDKSPDRKSEGKTAEERKSTDDAHNKPEEKSPQKASSVPQYAVSVSNALSKLGQRAKKPE